MVAIKTLLLEMVDERGACHIRELHIEILRERPGTPEHTIRARLSEAVADGVLDRLGDGFYDVYAEDEGMTSVVSYPNRCSLWGDSRTAATATAGCSRIWCCDMTRAKLPIRCWARAPPKT